jgi:hypothetical protein
MLVWLTDVAVHVPAKLAWVHVAPAGAANANPALIPQNNNRDFMISGLSVAYFL